MFIQGWKPFFFFHAQRARGETLSRLAPSGGNRDARPQGRPRPSCPPLRTATSDAVDAPADGTVPPVLRWPHTREREFTNVTQNTLREKGSKIQRTRHLRKPVNGNITWQSYGFTEARSPENNPFQYKKYRLYKITTPITTPKPLRHSVGDTGPTK